MTSAATLANLPILSAAAAARRPLCSAEIIGVAWTVDHACVTTLRVHGRTVEHVAFASGRMDVWEFAGLVDTFDPEASAVHFAIFLALAAAWAPAR